MSIFKWPLFSTEATLGFNVGLIFYSIIGSVLGPRKDVNMCMCNKLHSTCDL